MHLRQLRYLRLVIAKGSFAAAAREAGVTQPAITLAMQALEREWGIALFRKVGRQKLPTRAALLAAQSAADLDGRLGGLARDAWPALESGPATVATTLRVGMAPAATLLYGPAIERAWHRHEPAGLLRVVGGSAPELLGALQDDELDFVIAPRPRRYSPAGLRHQLLHTSMPTIHARVGHPLAKATSLKDIEAAGWAVTGRAGTAGNMIEEAHRVRGLPAPRILVQCADYTALLHLVAHSDLLCVVPHPMLLHEPERHAVCMLQILEGLPQYEVCMFWPPGRRARHRAAVDDITRMLKALVESDA